MSSQSGKFGEMWSEAWCAEALRRASLAKKALARYDEVFMRAAVGETIRWKHGQVLAKLVGLKDDYFLVVRPEGYKGTLTYHPMKLRIAARVPVNPNQTVRSRYKEAQDAK